MYNLVRPLIDYLHGPGEPLRPPSPPAVLAVAGHAVCLEWTPYHAATLEANDAGEAVQGEQAVRYTVECMPTAEAEAEGGEPPIPLTVHAQTTRCVVSGLEERTCYDVRLRAHLASGAATSFSALQQFRTRGYSAATYFGDEATGTLDELGNCFAAAEAVHDDDPALYLQSILRSHTLGTVVGDTQTSGWAVCYSRPPEAAAEGPSQVYVAFRGTGTQDLSKFIALVNDRANSKVFFVGHGRGGSEAVAVTASLLGLGFAEELVGRGRLQCVTFGAPFCTAAAAPACLSRGEAFYHVVCWRDPVPRLALAPPDQREELEQRLAAAGEPPADTDQHLAVQLQGLSKHLHGACTRDRDMQILGTLCVLDNPADFETREEFALPHLVEQMLGPAPGQARGLSAAAHQLCFYAQTFEQARAAREGDPIIWEEGMVLLRMEPSITQTEDSPTCRCVGNTLEVRLQGKNLLHVTAVSLCVEDRTVPLQITSKRMSDIVATGQVTLVGPLGRGVELRVRVDAADYGQAEGRLHIAEAGSFDPPPHSEEHDRMDAGALLRRLAAAALVCDERADTEKAKPNTAAQLLKHLEEVAGFLTGNAESRLRYVDKVCILPHGVSECDGSSDTDAVLTAYLAAAKTSEAAAAELESVVSGIEAALGKDVMLTASLRSDPAKMMVFAMKMGLVLGGVAAMMTPASPAVVLTESVAVSSGLLVGGSTVAATVAFHQHDYSKSAPFELSTYDKKLDFAVRMLGYSMREGLSAQFKELVVVREVRGQIERRCGDLATDRPTTRSLSQRGFMQLLLAVWEDESGDAASGPSSLDSGDKSLFAALLWIIVCVHDARRLLTCEAVHRACPSAAVATTKRDEQLPDGPSAGVLPAPAAETSAEPPAGCPDRTGAATEPAEPVPPTSPPGPPSPTSLPGPPSPSVPPDPARSDPASPAAVGAPDAVSSGTDPVPQPPCSGTDPADDVSAELAALAADDVSQRTARSPSAEPPDSPSPAVRKQLPPSEQI
eukprot:TRINITY_DN39335_c0_g1_i1.p1 TRINITY_DN39335_c0_g1~~TRINITY_DN39335_c0_g1_i1.p1  ORF type:complete len:1006 (+),score=191.52 TRINITY_DN39335_c0_g1_i1:55-3072(+)